MCIVCFMKIIVNGIEKKIIMDYLNILLHNLKVFIAGILFLVYFFYQLQNFFPDIS